MRSFRRLVSSESGQSMVEFAIILPLLLLLTFGTVELGILMERQITLTGAGFLAARAATVGGVEGNSPDNAAKEVLKAYAQDAGQPWMQDVVGQVKANADVTHRITSVRVVKKGETWNMLGTPVTTDLGGTMVINREFVRGKNSKSATQENSQLLVNYQASMPGLEKLVAFKSHLDPALGPIVSIAKQIPGMPPQVEGVVNVVRFEPLEAAAANPGDKPYRPGRTQADVYVSSDNEDPSVKLDFTGQPVLMKQSLMAGLDGLAALHAAAKNPSTGTTLGVALVALQTTLNIAIQTGCTVVEGGLRAVDGTVFGVQTP